MTHCILASRPISIGESSNITPAPKALPIPNPGDPSSSYDLKKSSLDHKHLLSNIKSNTWPDNKKSDSWSKYKNRYYKTVLVDREFNNNALFKFFSKHIYRVFIISFIQRYMIYLKSLRISSYNNTCHIVYSVFILTIIRISYWRKCIIINSRNN
jgi:hypothetical protein